MKNLPLHVKILIGLFLGVIWAFLSSYLGWNKFTITWIDPFGVIFIRLLKFIAIPLVLFSIISGVSGLSDVSRLGKLGGKTLAFYLVTTVTAVGLGLLLVNVVKPGASIEEEQRIKNRISYETWRLDNNMGPSIDGKSYMSMPEYQHLVSEAQKIELSEQNLQSFEEKRKAAEAKKNESPLTFFVEMVPENIVMSISNNRLMLQVIFFAIFFGITIVLVPEEQSRPLKNFVDSVNAVFLKMVSVVMNAAPFFVFALLAGVVAKMADTPAEVLEIFLGLTSFSLTTVFGLAFLVFVLYPLVLKTFVKKMTYGKFFKSLSPAQFLAFSTSSSAATLPVTMECVEQNMGVPRNLSSFVLPIGATVNMDGTSMYQAISVVFLAQLHLVDLNLSQQLTIVLTGTLVSIGAAGTPSASLVMMMMVLQSIGLNPAWVAIIFPVDRILDMCRTVVNVTGDATVCTLVAKTEGELKEA